MNDASFNKVELSGFAQNVKVRETGTGKNVANFSLKVLSFDKEGRERRQFVSCVAWQGLAEKLKAMGDGSRVGVKGRLTTASWADKTTGQRRYRLEVTADHLEPLARLQQPLSTKQEQVSEATEKNIHGVAIDDSDLPW